ncbi:hypothetical protein P7C70_g4080, partial [Phenoliferia sp. Uapishka_3]
MQASQFPTCVRGEGASIPSRLIIKDPSNLSLLDIKPSIPATLPRSAFQSRRPSPSFDSVPTASQISRTIAWARTCGTSLSPAQKRAMVQNSLRARDQRETDILRLERAPPTIRRASIARPNAMDVDRKALPNISNYMASICEDDEPNASADQHSTSPIRRAFQRRGAMRPTTSPSVKRKDTMVEIRDGKAFLTRCEVMEQTTAAGYRVYRRVAVTDASPRHQPYSVPGRISMRKASLGGGGHTVSQIARMRGPFSIEPPSLPPIAQLPRFSTPSMSSRRRSIPRLTLRLATPSPIKPHGDTLFTNPRPTPILREESLSPGIRASSVELQDAVDFLQVPSLSSPSTVDRARESGMALLGAAIEMLEKAESSICGRRGKLVMPLALA